MLIDVLTLGHNEFVLAKVGEKILGKMNSNESIRVEIEFNQKKFKQAYCVNNLLILKIKSQQSNRSNILEISSQNIKTLFHNVGDFTTNK